MFVCDAACFLEGGWVGGRGVEVGWSEYNKWSSFLQDSCVRRYGGASPPRPRAPRFNLLST